MAVIAMSAIVLVAGISTGTTGLGYAQLAAVGLAFVVDARTAVILLSITVPPVSTIQLVRHRASTLEWRKRMRALFMGCLVGVPIGAYLLTLLPTRIIALLLGIFTIAFVVMRIRRPVFGIAPDQERILAPLVGLAAGLFNGMIGVSGPILGSYLIALGVSAATFAFTVQSLFLTMTLLRLGGLAALGQITAPLLATGAVLLVPAVVGQTVGFWLQGRVSAGGFERAVLVVMVIAGGGLVIRGIGLTGGG